MKKKTMAFGGLLMAVAMTGYSVSGTYAKYISQVDLVDEARVAKWELNATDKNNNKIGETIDLFASSYTNDGKTYVSSLNCSTTGEGENAKTVCDKVVAPGTKGDYTAKLTGKMETRFQLGFDLVSENDFVVYFNLKTETGKSTVVDEMKVAKELTTNDTDKSMTYVKTLADGTTETVIVVKADGTLSEGWYEYHPIRYTVDYRTPGKDDKAVTLTNYDINGIKLAFEAYNTNNANALATGNLAHTFNPTNNFNKQIVVSWEWATHNTSIALSHNTTTGVAEGNVLTDKVTVAANDKATEVRNAIVNTLDTYAGNTLSDVEDRIKFGVEITAEQVTADEVTTSKATTTPDGNGNPVNDSEKYSKKN